MTMIYDAVTTPPARIIDELTYCSYRANRGYGMTPEQYARMVKIDVAQYETRYQQEQTNV